MQTQRRWTGPGRSRGATFGLVAALSVACATSAPARRPSTPSGPARTSANAPKAGETNTGIASWYGPGFHGKRTACGEPFDQDALTAAHGTYPCGTRVRVTLLSSNKSVVVTVNDKFPRHKGRLIDVSRGAARAIGLIGPGTGRVRVEVVE